MCLLLSPVLLAAQTPAAPQTNRWSTNWTALFDGKTLTNWAVTDFAGHGPSPSMTAKLNSTATTSAHYLDERPAAQNRLRNLSRCRQSGGQRFFLRPHFSSRRFRMQPDCRGWAAASSGCPASMVRTLRKTKRAIHVSSDRALVSYRGAGHARKNSSLAGQGQIIDVSIAKRKVALRPGPIYLSAPLGIATYSTTAKIKDFKLRRLNTDSAKPCQFIQPLPSVSSAWISAACFPSSAHWKSNWAAATARSWRNTPRSVATQFHRGGTVAGPVRKAGSQGSPDGIGKLSARCESRPLIFCSIFCRRFR